MININNLKISKDKNLLLIKAIIYIIFKLIEYILHNIKNSFMIFKKCLKKQFKAENINIKKFLNI